MTPITTQRLVLRKFLPQDAEALLAYFREPRAACFADERLSGMEEALAGIRARNARPDGAELAVCCKTRGTLMGNLFSQPEEHGNVGVGWHFNPAFTGKGYATEAATAYLDFLFGVKKARRIYAYVDENNLPSQRLCRRLGMRKEGLLREFATFVSDDQGRPIYENTLIFALLRSEWAAGPSCRL